MNELEQTTCKMCGRKLKSNASIIRGMGEKCWQKFLKQNDKQLFEIKVRTDDKSLCNQGDRCKDKEGNNP